jgi:hypothetical protein
MECISDADLSMPDTDTQLFVSYAYADEHGKRHIKTMELRGEQAEHAASIVSRFESFMRSTGYDVDIKVKPIRPLKTLQRAAQVLALTCFAATGMLSLHGAKANTVAPRKHRLSVTALIAMPMRAA